MATHECHTDCLNLVDEGRTAIHFVILWDTMGTAVLLSKKRRISPIWSWTENKNKKNNILSWWTHVSREEVMPGQVGSEQLGIMAASQLQGSRFDPELGLQSVLRFICSTCMLVWVCSKFSGSLSTPKNMPVGKLVAWNCRKVRTSVWMVYSYITGDVRRIDGESSMTWRRVLENKWMNESDLKCFKSDSKELFLEFQSTIIIFWIISQQMIDCYWFIYCCRPFIIELFFYFLKNPCFAPKH